MTKLKSLQVSTSICKSLQVSAVFAFLCKSLQVFASKDGKDGKDGKICLPSNNLLTYRVGMGFK